MPLHHDIAYALAATAAAPVLAPYYWRTGKWRTDWAARFGRGPAIRDGQADDRDGYRPTLLVHAVSVGEVNAIRQLVTHLAEQPHAPRLVISSTTDTGYARARELYEPAHPVVRPTFARLAAAAVQSPADASRFEALGTPIDRIRVLDTMKWDTARLRDDVPGSDTFARALGIDPDRPTVVAGSTGDGEERQLIDQLASWPAGTQLVLVPRKPERFDAVAQLAPEAVRRSAHPDTSKPPRPAPAHQRRVFLVDTMGELGKAYALANVAVVGRSFNGWGGSDPIEPVALGKPALMGPDHGNFQHVVAALRSGGGLLVTDAPGRTVGELLADPARAKRLADAGRAVIRQRQGSTARHAELLHELLPHAARGNGTTP